MDYVTGQINLIIRDAAPTLEIKRPSGEIEEVPFEAQPHLGKTFWQATPKLPAEKSWRFRIRLSNGRYIHNQRNTFFKTPLHTLWFRDKQIFRYRPGRRIANSQVRRIDGFEGRLSPRPIYIYLPRGYEANIDKQYPIIYMHDGQNVFETFVEDSYAGSWQADLTADRLIRQGQIPECIIVGVSHGDEDRIQEYLPPYTKGFLPSKDEEMRAWVYGRADKTAAYYIEDVAPYIEQTYRVKNGRQHRALCGSSMGGLFTLYMGWEYPHFARNLAALSPSIWITKNEKGKYSILERLRRSEPPDVRLWIDSGTYASNGKGDDGQVETVVASEILLQNGFVDGGNLQHYLDRGANHSEEAWAGRLHKIFKYLLWDRETPWNKTGWNNNDE